MKSDNNLPGKVVPIKIINPHGQSGWITCIISGRWVQAKVYDEPSHYGVNDYSRTSKLCIGKTDIVRSNQNFFEQIDYNYDRGLDFNNLEDKDLVNDVVKTLETLPKIF